MTPAFHIAVVGGINMDIVVGTEKLPTAGASTDGYSFEHLCGGKGANIAVAAHRASHNRPANTTSLRPASAVIDTDIHVHLNSAIGDDHYGTILRQELTEENIDMSGVQVLTDAPTSCCIVVYERSGECFTVAQPGANHEFRPREDLGVTSLGGRDRTKPDLVVLVLFGDDERIASSVLRMAGSAGVDTLVSTAYNHSIGSSELYRYVTHLIMNQHEAAVLAALHLKTDQAEENSFEKLGDTFVSLGVQNVVITLGDQGAYYVTHTGQRGYVEAEKDINVVDATGSGDSFNGAYAVQYAQQKRAGTWDIVKAIRFACKAAAKTIQVVGAQGGLPFADDLL